MPDIEFTSDIIVGFPGETYADFCETLSLVREVEFFSLFTFIYSPREGTPAAVMEDPISREEKGKWFSELLAAQDEISKKLCDGLVGKRVRVLVEEETECGVLSGKTAGYATVEFPGDSSLIGSFREVEITEYTNALSGVLVK